MKSLYLQRLDDVNEQFKHRYSDCSTIDSNHPVHIFTEVDLLTYKIFIRYLSMCPTPDTIISHWLIHQCVAVYKTSFEEKFKHPFIFLNCLLFTYIRCQWKPQKLVLCFYLYSPVHQTYFIRFYPLNHSTSSWKPFQSNSYHFSWKRNGSSMYEYNFKVRIQNMRFDVYSQYLFQ